MDVTAAALPLIFDDGTEYLLSPLTDKDLAELDEWVQARFVYTARKSLPPEASKEEREETLRIAMEQAMGMTWLCPAGIRMLSTIEGMARLVWQAAKRNHPTLEVNHVRRYMIQRPNLEAANAVIKRMTATRSEVAKKKGNPRKRAKKR